MYKIVLVVTSLLIFLILPAQSSAWELFGKTQPTAASELLAESLSQKIALTEANIQLHPSNFLDQVSGRELAFSKVLAEALGASLSAHGAVVSVWEQGDNPLRLLGSYGLNDDQLTITVRIREMGKTNSSDLAVAQTTIDRDDIQESWFQSGLADLAEGLIKDLEKKIMGFDDPLVTMEQPQPGMQGQATVKFGSELRKHLERAIKDSDLLDATAIGGKRAAYTLQSQYSRFQESMRVELRLTGPDGLVVALAKTDIALNRFQPEFLVMQDDQNLSVCVRYKQRDRRDIKEGSAEEASLVDVISGALGRYGIQATSCEQEQSYDRQIVASMRLTEKNTRDGYGLMKGDLLVTIVTGQEKITSTLKAQEKAPFSGSSEGAVEKIVEKMFDDTFQEELAANILRK